jgi:hypothetical protein
MIEYTKAEKLQLLDNSIERVINTSMELAQRAERSRNEHLSELGSTNRQDWEELKELVVKIWNDQRNEVFQKG